MCVASWLYIRFRSRSVRSTRRTAKLMPCLKANTNLAFRARHSRHRVIIGVCRAIKKDGGRAVEVEAGLVRRVDFTRARDIANTSSRVFHRRSHYHGSTLILERTAYMIQRKRDGLRSCERVMQPTAVGVVTCGGRHTQLESGGASWFVRAVDKFCSNPLARRSTLSGKTLLHSQNVELFYYSLCIIYYGE